MLKMDAQITKILLYEKYATHLHFSFDFAIIMYYINTHDRLSILKYWHLYYVIRYNSLMVYLKKEKHFGAEFIIVYLFPILKNDKKAGPYFTSRKFR